MKETLWRNSHISETEETVLCCQNVSALSSQNNLNIFWDENNFFFSCLYFCVISRLSLSCGLLCLANFCKDVLYFRLFAFVYYFYIPDRSFMHLPVSAWFLLSSADFIYRCIIFLNCTSAVKKYYAPAHAQMRKKKRKVGGFSEKNGKPIENIFVNVQLKLWKRDNFVFLMK